MSWNLLPFAYPLLNIVHTYNKMDPETFKEYDAMPESPQAAVVRTIVKRVLEAENARGSQYFKRIQAMLQALPKNAGPKTIDTLLQHRLKVISPNAPDTPFAFATGTDYGKYFIGIKPGPQAESALPWLVTHALGHILNNDVMNLSVIHTASSLAIATLSVYTPGGWSWQTLLTAIIATEIITGTIHSQISMRAADNFANKYCSEEELRQGISFLEGIKASRATDNYVTRFIARLLHPSEDSRIASIRKALFEKAKAA